MWTSLRVHTTRFYLMTRKNADGSIDKAAAVCDDFGQLIFVIV